MPVPPPTQYADDTRLRARQAIWKFQDPPFDLVGWVAGLMELSPGARVLDAGCGNGSYVHALVEAGVSAVGCDLSAGMLAGVDHSMLVNGDVAHLPFADGAFDAVLSAHMLYHVEDRRGAVSELRRVLDPQGTFVAVTNGKGLMASVTALVEEAVHRSDPGWVMPNPSVFDFSLENGAQQLSHAFGSVKLVRPSGVGDCIIGDASVVADYVASVGDVYGPAVGQPWESVVEFVGAAVSDVIAREGVFVTRGDVGAFVCRP